MIGVFDPRTMFGALKRPCLVQGLRTPQRVFYGTGLSHAEEIRSEVTCMFQNWANCMRIAAMQHYSLPERDMSAFSQERTMRVEDKRAALRDCKRSRVVSPKPLPLSTLSEKHTARSRRTRLASRTVCFISRHVPQGIDLTDTLGRLPRQRAYQP